MTDEKYATMGIPSNMSNAATHPLRAALNAAIAAEEAANHDLALRRLADARKALGNSDCPRNWVVCNGAGSVSRTFTNITPAQLIFFSHGQNFANSWYSELGCDKWVAHCEETGEMITYDPGVTL